MISPLFVSPPVAKSLHFPRPNLQHFATDEAEAKDDGDLSARVRLDLSDAYAGVEERLLMVPRLRCHASDQKASVFVRRE